MSKFKAGDRVSVYLSVWGDAGGIAIRKASVEEPCQSFTVKGVEAVWVCLDTPVRMSCSHDGEEMTEYSRIWVHPKQCRRLKPRKRREWWISTQIEQQSFMSDGRCTHITDEPTQGWIHVREVLTRKAKP